MKPSILTEYNRIEKKLQRIESAKAKPQRKQKPVAKVINLYSKFENRRAA